MIFTQLICVLEKRCSNSTEQIRLQQEAKVSQVKELQVKLQREIAELRRTDGELQQVSRSDNHWCWTCYSWKVNKKKVRNLKKKNYSLRQRSRNFIVKLLWVFLHLLLVRFPNGVWCVSALTNVCLSSPHFKPNWHLWVHRTLVLKAPAPLQNWAEKQHQRTWCLCLHSHM